MLRKALSKKDRPANDTPDSPSSAPEAVADPEPSASPFRPPEPTPPAGTEVVYFVEETNGDDELDSFAHEVTAESATETQSATDADAADLGSTEANSTLTWLTLDEISATPTAPAPEPSTPAPSTRIDTSPSPSTANFMALADMADTNPRPEPAIVDVEPEPEIVHVEPEPEPEPEIVDVEPEPKPEPEIVHVEPEPEQETVMVEAVEVLPLPEPVDAALIPAEPVVEAAAFEVERTATESDDIAATPVEPVLQPGPAAPPPIVIPAPSAPEPDGPTNLFLQEPDEPIPELPPEPDPIEASVPVIDELPSFGALPTFEDMPIPTVTTATPDNPFAQPPSVHPPQPEPRPVAAAQPTPEPTIAPTIPAPDLSGPEFTFEMPAPDMRVSPAGAATQIADLLRAAHDTAVRLRSHAEVEIQRSVDAARAEVQAHKQNQMRVLDAEQAAAEQIHAEIVHNARLAATDIRSRAEEQAAEIRAAADAVLAQAAAHAHAAKALVAHNLAEIEAAKEETATRGHELINASERVVLTIQDLDDNLSERLVHTDRMIEMAQRAIASAPT
ncbi:MAG: hypothetical protein AAGA37_03325 [Actinomycetota bacterium]